MPFFSGRANRAVCKMVVKAAVFLSLFPGLVVRGTVTPASAGDQYPLPDSNRCCRTENPEKGAANHPLVVWRPAQASE